MVQPIFLFPLRFLDFLMRFWTFWWKWSKTGPIRFFDVSGVKAFALTGRIADCYYTQGAALGYELLPFQGVSFSPPSPVIS